MTRDAERRRRRGRAPLCETLEDRRLLAVSLAFDYSLDSGFFTADRRAVLESTLNAIASRLGDTLAPVPTTRFTLDTNSGTRTVTSSSPADVVKVYAYGRSLTGSIAQGGAYYSVGAGNSMRGEGPNDFAPDITYLMFDDDGSTNWFFGATTAGLTRSQIDFVTVARHEFLHSLGFISQPTFQANMQGTSFVGANARAANGGAAVPMSGSHVASGVRSIMNPVTMAGQRSDLGELEWAMLKDIGWSVVPPSQPPPPPPPPPPPAGGDPLYVDQGANGLWRWTLSGGWTQINAADPQGIAVAPDGSLFVDYGPFGLWRWSDSTGMRQIHDADPEAIAPGSDGSLFVDYGPAGLWRWTAGAGLRRLNEANPRSFAAGPSGELFVEYGQFGLWVWTESAWLTQLHPQGPEGMAVADEGTLYLDYGAGGLWSRSRSNAWAKINDADAQGLAAGSDGVMHIDFGVHGHWEWSPASGYRQVNLADPIALAGASDGWLYIDYGGNGTWRWKSGVGFQQIDARSFQRLAVRSPVLRR
ncbi:hypothetical protein [Paludisphaera sp.]|uniref:hypothetical protein n=1 Tax=Paludisphaera sp. TaxID=2017432 RepID=UPI00301CFBF9